jgi:hypothetical protein
MLTGSVVFMSDKRTYLSKDLSTSCNCENAVQESSPCLDVSWNKIILSPEARVATNTKAHTFLFIVDDILPTVMQVTLESSDPPLDAHSQRSHKTY